MAKILNGTKVAKEIESNIKNEIIKNNYKPVLAAVLIGEDSRSALYVEIKRKKCTELNIGFKLFKVEKYNEKEVLTLIDKLNKDKEITGILVQLPLPNNEDPAPLFNMIEPNKDVDGITPLNIGNSIMSHSDLIPCTAKGIITLLDYYKIDLKGKNVVVIGASHIVGRPISRLLLNKDATVTTCHIETKDLKLHTKNADIIISATGHKHLITKDHVSPDTTIIDVGITKENGIIFGDVDFDNVEPIVTNITNHPGGVGPMTVSSLMLNILLAYKLQR
jgi:methylenetetrahydrofolate dehydrogenase (NADP+)/methenyltetrahydrofolate cyclohydrolase